MGISTAISLLSITPSLTFANSGWVPCATLPLGGRWQEYLPTMAGARTLAVLMAMGPQHFATGPARYAHAGTFRLLFRANLTKLIAGC